VRGLSVTVAEAIPTSVNSTSKVWSPLTTS
jgi:hypothetical protein